MCLLQWLRSGNTLEKLKIYVITPHCERRSFLAETSFFLLYTCYPFMLQMVNKWDPGKPAYPSTTFYCLVKLSKGTHACPQCCVNRKLHMSN